MGGGGGEGERGGEITGEQWGRRSIKYTIAITALFQVLATSTNCINHVNQSELAHMIDTPATWTIMEH